MTENDKSETSDLVNAHMGKTGSDSETSILTQKEIDEQVKNFIAPLTKQL